MMARGSKRGRIACVKAAVVRLSRHCGQLDSSMELQCCGTVSAFSAVINGRRVAASIGAHPWMHNDSHRFTCPHEWITASLAKSDSRGSSAEAVEQAIERLPLTRFTR